MYHSYYGLREPPFELTPDPKFLHLTPVHREALSNLEYGLSAAKSLTILTGEAGTGKTTLLRAALQSERCASVRCVYLSNPTLTRDEFVRTLATRFSLGEDAAESKALMLERLERTLLERRQQGAVNALVVDEAQSLSHELLEEIRLLANIETEEQKLLPLVLAGQPELSDRLEDPSLRQLKQRVALRCHIRPFDLFETAAYIAARIKIAGGVPAKLFTREGVSIIHEYSGGIPRTISVICDNALLSGMALDRQPVDCAMILEVCRDFHLRGKTSGAEAPPNVSSMPGKADADPAPEQTDAENGGQSFNLMTRPSSSRFFFVRRQAPARAGAREPR